MTVVEASTYSEEGVIDVRNVACEALLAQRVEQKLKGSRIQAVANKIHVAIPVKRDNVERTPFIPDAVKSRVKYDKEDPERRKLERDYEQALDGIDVYSVDMKKNYILADDSWKYDVMPEFYNGKNVADFIDPDIEEKLEALEREEEALEAQGFYASDDEDEMVSVTSGLPKDGILTQLQLDTDEEEFRDAAAQIRKKKATMTKLSQEKNRLQNKPVIPRKKRHVTLDEFTHGMRKHGHDPSVLEKRAARMVEQKKTAWEEANARDAASSVAGGMDVDMDEGVEGAPPSRAALKRKAAAVTTRAPRTNRQMGGLATQQQSDKAVELRNFAQREPNRLAKASESDRHIPITRPKWMLAGKRKGGKTERR